jgi:MoaA/NifB/PqqE/SkfB family radical SAM enzyme
MACDSFCILAFNHIQIDPNGDCRLCCRATDVVRDPATGISLNIKNVALDHIFNSSYYVKVREQMRSGQPVEACARCYADESLYGSSYRTFSNSKWQHDPAARAELQPSLEYIQVNPGNICNLQCKSCNADYSSSIEANPVHAQWSPGLAKGSQAIKAIPASNRLQVTTQELIDLGSYLATVYNLHLSDYTLYVPEPPGKRVQQIRVHTASGEQKTVDPDVIRHAPRQRLAKNLVHVLALDVWAADVYGAQGFEIDYVHLADSSLASAQPVRPARPQSLLWRFSTDADWHAQDAVIFGDILANAATLKELYFTGGEPMMSPLFPKVLRYLRETGFADTIKIQLNSNISLLTADIVDLLLGFKDVQFSVSLDGTGEVYEYIRYPSKYANIQKRLELLRGAQMSITLVPILSCFNASNLPEIAALADSFGFDLSIYPAQGPAFVDCSCLAPSAADRAIHAVEQWCASNPHSTLLQQMQSALVHLREARSRHTPDMTKLMLSFCRDVDSQSGRWLADYIPELYTACTHYLEEVSAVVH